MSRHEKPEEQYLYEYEDATRPNQAPSYQDFSQPPLAARFPLSRAPSYHGVQAASSTPYSSALPFQPRDIHTQQGAFIPPTLPAVTSYSPRSGFPGSILRVNIRLDSDLLAQSFATVFFIMFGGTRRQATAGKADSTDGYYHYILDTEIPTLDESLSPGTQVPLSLHLEDEYGHSLGTVEVGDFTFASPTPGYSYSVPAFRKRKQSAEPPEYMDSPPKRSVSQQAMERTHRPSYSDPPRPSHVSPYMRAASAVPYGMTPTAQTQQLYGQSGLPEQYPYTPMPYSQPGMASPAMAPSAYSHVSRSPSASVAIPRPTQAGTMVIGYPSTASSSSNPTLVRSTSVRPSPLVPTTPSSQQTFNPYAMYPTSKAAIELDGNLDSMAEKWTDDEIAANRRLVEFQRSQAGGTIKATFKPVTPERRIPNSICISCIWWEARDECYVTSVDTIYLLESLVAVRFTVEEKNRIRRNLEGFRPLTVSKLKADSKEFFDVIMKFPNPKPRNIEKDVKVFPWKILSRALTKIVGKYVASYSSTAGALHPAAGPSYTGSAQPSSSEPSADVQQRVTASPSSSSTVSRSTMAAAAQSPTLAMPGPMQGSTLSGDHHRSSQSIHNLMPQDQYGVQGISNLGHTQMGWPAQQTQQPQQLPQYSPPVPQTGRESWDYSAYLPGSFGSMTAAPGSAQQYLPYQRPSASSLGSAEQEQGQPYAGQSYGVYGLGAPRGPSGSHNTSNA